ncbi:ABC transporter ATP-binding protein [Burkholderia ubonensis]|uniref:ABC transporter ATP-binding protein n=1 Tax=Burkholderia ubonensis TaxID=101571 RepID=UPI002ABDB973|nr:ABC transporter ATP-binding protein [Burkholderia ubonensis]
MPDPYMPSIFSSFNAKLSTDEAPTLSVSAASTSQSSAGHAVEFVDLCKRYDETLALDRINLKVQAGEFVSLLGPSGSGKSTLLMVLAGFESVSAGDILVGGRSVVGVPAQRRDQGVVFQSYALFPNMTVAENVAFPLKARGIPAHEQKMRVARALDRVRMGAFAERRPSQLSGGQQQRVALARAIVFDPPLILMDESLSALDRRLRQEMQYELKELHRSLGKTIIYVTHDQDEALAMSDRIALMHGGRLVQIGSPQEIYDAPVDRFAASFIGDANFLDGIVSSQVGNSSTVTARNGLTISGHPAAGLKVGDKVACVVRPEAIRLLERYASRPETGAHVATVTGVLFLGDSLNYRVDWNGHPLIVKSSRRFNEVAFREGDSVELEIDGTRVSVVPA